ncbi:hypothetical protein MKOR_12440 [Mycolicibacillus koreensis]|nr:hypothetical protein MKOR_12440 [Mycolicibacillus koreensis]
MGVTPVSAAEALNLPPRPLRAHQRAAVAAVDPTLARQQVIMACGTGKTLTGMHAVAKLLGAQSTSGRVLVLVPTLTLLEQTYRAWRDDAPLSFDAIAVCSRLSAAQRRGVGVESDADPSELSLHATTAPMEIARFLSGAGRKLVFGTYQSLGALVDAHRSGAPGWDVVVCDEAHRTAGAAGKAFGRVLHDEHIPADHRLFLTATPRVHSAPAAGSKGGAQMLASMDDEALYGPAVYTLSVAEAIRDKILSPYQVAVIGVSDAEIEAATSGIATVTVGGHRLDADHVASIIALSKAAQQRGLHAVIAYFNSIRASREFVQAFQVVHAARTLGGGTAEHIDGSMKLAHRGQALSRLAAERTGLHLVSNARCLTEGIDVPVLDAVLFGQPRTSQIDVVQCVGRAIRRNPRSDAPALIVLAVRIGDGQDPEAAVAEAGFTKVRQVIAALGDHDPRIEEAARTLSRDCGRDGNGPSDDDLDSARGMISLDIPQELLHNGFGLRLLLDHADQAWERGFAELSAYVDEHGHSRVPQSYVADDGYRLGKWVRNQREAYRNEKLSTDRVARLEALPGWAWNTLDDKWELGFAELSAYVAEHGHSRVPVSYVTADGYRLGRWVEAQRRAYRSGTLFADRIVRLEALPGWTWSDLDSKWEQGFAELSAYVAKHGHGRVPARYVTADGYCLGQWVVNQREIYRSGDISTDRITRLEALHGWAWSDLDSKWEQGFAELSAYVAKHGHSRVPQCHITADGYRLGQWVATQRRAYRNGKLPANRTARLEALPGWAWNTLDEQWERGYAEVQTYAAEHGHSRVPTRHVTADGYRLGNWVNVQRTAYRDGKLSADRVARLEALPGWVWDAR